MSRKKNLLLIGSGGDIGRSTHDVLMSHGWNVLATTRNTLDLSDKRSIEQFIDDLNAPIEHVVFTAAINEPRLFCEIERAQIDLALDINVLSFIEILQRVVNQMPNVVNRSVTVVSSLFGQTGREGRLAYSMTKHALEGAVKTLAVELGPLGVRVNCVSPGFVDTKLTRKNISEDQIRTLERRIPIGRLGAPEDIANAIAFLVSDEARYITGANLTVDGGFMAGGLFKND